MTSRAMGLFAALGLITAWGCGKSAAKGSAPSGSSAVTCSNDPRADAYAANLTKTGTQGLLKLVLKSTNPSPPARDLNTWILEIQDSHGAPVSGATIPTIKTWMPDHGHGATVIPQASVSGPQATITQLDFFMAGLWQVTFTVSAAGQSDTVIFAFCVPG